MHREKEEIKKEKNNGEKNEKEEGMYIKRNGEGRRKSKERNKEWKYLKRGREISGEK